METMRFGKKSGDVLGLKGSFFSENDQHLERNAAIQRVYLAQPRRTQCKNCGAALGANDFVSHGIPYVLCTHCSHLNGAHEDTPEFCEATYTDHGGSAYSQNYSDADRYAYRQRTQIIYLPKADFLLESLASEGQDPRGLRFADFGAGAGFFVAAMLDRSVDIMGYEVSPALASMGHAILGEDKIRVHHLDATIELLGSVEADVVSMIGVLEHLRNPREALHAISLNPRIKYFYFSVPLLSLSVFVELFFQAGFNRQLGGGHTHLYTERSIKHFVTEFGFQPAASWWFGTDVVDFFRHGSVYLRQHEASEATIGLFGNILGKHLDDLQAVLDRSKDSSEVHMLVRNAQRAG